MILGTNFSVFAYKRPPKDRTKGRILLTGICVISERCLAAVRKASSDMWEVPVKIAASPMAGKMYALFACTHISLYEFGSTYSKLLILRTGIMIYEA